MELVLHLDPQGLIQVDLVATPDEREAAHRFWQAVRPLAEDFGLAVQRISVEQKPDIVQATAVDLVDSESSIQFVKEKSLRERSKA